MDSVERKATKNILKLRRHLLAFTCRLVRLNKDGDIVGIASGFLIDRSGMLILLSAGHALKRGNWCLETDVSFENESLTLLIPLREITYFKKLSFDSLVEKKMKAKVIEFAYAKLDRSALENEIKKDARLSGKAIKLQIYKGPLDHEPIIADEPYSYSSWNKVLFIRAFKSFLERDATGEFGMVYEGGTNDKQFYIFRLPASTKGINITAVRVVPR